jgi:hypothetical protein
MNEVGIPKGTFCSLWTESSSGIDTPKKRANKLALFQIVSKCPECRHPVVYPAGPPHPHLRTAGCLTIEIAKLSDSIHAGGKPPIFQESQFI